jgi:fatty acid desaturase
LPLHLDDLQPRRALAPTGLERRLIPLLNDPRDLPFVRLMALIAVTVVPLGVYLLIPGNWNPLLAAVHLGLLGWLLPSFTLMLHNTSHRRLFVRKHQALGNVIPVVLGPFFGQTPFTYFAHHVGMHHPENNLDEDISSTMGYQRDSFVDFLRYLGRFLAFGILDLARYLSSHRRAKLLRKAVAGELCWAAAVVALLALGDWRGTLTVLVLPLVLCRALMMAGNWGQHAFIDASDPGSAYRNSITCVDTPYNRRCFNDGYHISHHLDANRHWTEHPLELAQNEAAYAAGEAIVFRGIDFMGVWFLLMLHRYDRLASHFVRLDGDRRTDEEIAAFLESRTQAIGAAESPALAV